MQTMNSSNHLHQDCLGKLQKILDLAMKTAESASAEGNHKIVLQAAREVTRIVTLMTKMAKTSGQEGKAKTKTAPDTTKTPSLPNRQANPQKLSAVQELELYQKIFPDLFQPQIPQGMKENRNPAILEVGKKRESNGIKPDMK